MDVYNNHLTAVGDEEKIEEQVLESNNDGCLIQTNANERNKPGQLFYSVYIPPENANNKREFHVYADRVEALRFFKLHKRARFKPFTKETDAVYFSQYGSLPTQSISVKSNTQSNVLQAHQQVQEKSLFKTPKLQEMTKFRKTIEGNDIEQFKIYVKENPRYLISSGDTPSILQEGPRYNALHIAAKFNAPNIASHILTMISTSELTNRIYGTNETGIDTDQRAKVLLDLYLNTPDRSLNERPLHFASKVGAVAVVEILIMYPQCMRDALNKYGRTPLDLVCSRATGEALSNKESIEFLLKEDNFYVPVLRTNDNSVQPKVGNPITKTGVLDSLPTATKEFELYPSAKVHALAGPMTKDEAASFQKQWKKSPYSIERSLKPSLLDPDKGLERIGRDLAVKFHVQWTEYWTFLEAFVDLSSVEGLDLLETYLKDKFCDTVAQWQPASKLTDNNINSQAVNNMSEQEPLSPISDFCANFNSLHISEGPSPETVDMPVMCFEKFLEVFARRLSTSLFRCHQIFHEISHLETFLTSCSRDRRFDSIDLTKAHYRLSELVESNLRNLTNSEELTSILTSLIELNISDETEEDDGIIRSALVCISSFLLDNLSSQSSRNASSNKSLQNSWLRSKCCGCKLLRGSRVIFSARTRLNFHGEEENNSHNTTDTGFNNKTEVSKLKENKADSPIIDDNLECWPLNNSQTENDDSDESYYTAPASPFHDENQYYDCVDVTDGTDIFLAGDIPTKLDSSVLNAIKDVTIITPNTYPFIYYWKKTCENRAVLEHTSKWPTPRYKSSQNRVNKEPFPPSWHR